MREIKDRKSYYPKTCLKQYAVDVCEMMFGLLLFGVGSYFTVQANVGLAPWWAFSVGISNVTGIPYGTIHVVTALAIILLDIVLKEKVGWGTLADAVAVGSLVALFDSFHILPLQENYWIGIIWMLIGLFIIAIGTYFYMDAAFSCGPRDALMVAICRILSKLPVGLNRILLEGSALLIGWLLGAKAGLGTVIAVLGIGVFIEIVFRVTKFDPTKVEHESFLDTYRNLLKIKRGDNKA